MYNDPRTLKTVDQLTWLNYDTSATTVPSETDLVKIWLGRLNFNDIEKQNYLNGIQTNWKDVISQTGLQQDYNVSVSNKGKAGSIYASLGYADREGYIKGTGYKNLRGRINFESDINKWLTVGANMQLAARDNSIVGITDDSTFLSPYTTDTSDDLSSPYCRYPNGDNGASNPFWAQQFIDNSDMRYDAALNMYAKVKLPFGFEFQSNWSPRIHFEDYYRHYSSKHDDYEAVGGKSTRNYKKTYNWQIDNVLRWQKEFGQHRIEATFMQNAEKDRYWYETTSSQGYASDVLSYHRMQAGTTQSLSTEDTYATGDALMARLFYQFNNRYMLTASVRRDGYSAFGVNNPRGTFPSIALGWVFSQEKFMRGADSWLDYGKLRLSWGVNGNRDIGQYSALSRIASEFYYYMDQSGNPYIAPTYYVSTLGNASLSWEKTAAYNVGLDFTLFKGFVDGSIDAYKSTTTNLLVDRVLPNVTGYSDITSNMGELSNHGFELTANFHPFDRTNFKWDSSFNFFFNRRKIVHLYGEMVDVLDDNGNVIGQKESDDSTNGWYIGHDPNEIYDYEMGGVWQSDEAEEASKYGNQPGDFKYIDQNGDGTLNEADKIFTGHYKTPRFQFSWRNDFTLFKNWTAGFMMYAKLGMWTTYNQAAFGFDNYHRRNWYDLPYWTEENPTNDYARIASVNLGNHYANSSFLRLESVHVSYNIPKSFLKKILVENARFTVSVRNPYVFTKWSFGDPEVASGDYTYRSVNFSLNVTL